MSRRRRRDPPDEFPPELDDPEDSPDEVEYFVEVEEDDSVFTSVPNSVQSLQTSSSAPSTLMVLGFAVSAPHISH
ncbi:hypothetical protein GCM10009021_25980 [Halarchaeum nitratireducens]|uniref:Uncharacterized protein n=1 Tax=Halarchaeum nitratireducens TaxID=489913 RepID=A0A830GD35_9EURY|nr:hypothetical protein GCM10009021_25980 [Halarchaeum nitratireducens]